MYFFGEDLGKLLEERKKKQKQEWDNFGSWDS